MMILTIVTKLMSAAGFIIRDDVGHDENDKANVLQVALNSHHDALLLFVYRTLHMASLLKYHCARQIAQLA